MRLSSFDLDRKRCPIQRLLFADITSTTMVWWMGFVIIRLFKSTTCCYSNDIFPTCNVLGSTFGFAFIIKICFFILILNFLYKRTLRRQRIMEQPSQRLGKKLQLKNYLLVNSTYIIWKKKEDHKVGTSWNNFKILPLIWILVSITCMHWFGNDKHIWLFWFVNYFHMNRCTIA